MKKILLLFLGIFIISFASAFNWNDGTLISYYKFDETSGTTAFDSYVNGYDGTLTNMEADEWTTDGKINGAIEFNLTQDNTEFISVTDNADLDGLKTVSFWANITDETNTPAGKVFFEKDSDFRGVLAYISNANEIAYYNASQIKVISITGITNNIFHHIVMTYDGVNNITIYIDGEQNKSSNAVGSAEFNNAVDFTIGGSSLGGGARSISGIIDEMGIWDRVLSSSEVSELYNGGLGLSINIENITSSLNLPTNNSLITGDINFTSNQTSISGFNITNATIVIWNSTDDIFFSQTKITLGTINSTLFSVDNLTSGSYKWNVLACAENITNSECAYAGNNFTFNWAPFTIIDQIWNNNTIEGSLEEFSIELNVSENSSFQIASLVYDGVSYAGTINNLGSGTFNITRTIAIPTVSTLTNKTFFWQIIMSDGFQFNTTTLNQSVDTFLIDDCSIYTKKLLNFTMLNESNFNGVSGTIELNVNVFTNQTNNIVGSFSKTFDYTTGINALVCLQNITEDYSLSYEVRHFSNESNQTAFKKYRNIQKMTINTNTPLQNITLYNLPSGEGKSFNIIVVGNLLSSTGNADLLVEVQRKYVGIGLFKLVESPITSSEGEAIANLIPLEIIYTFVISYNGQTLGTFNNYQVQCSNPSIDQCSIILNLGQSSGSQADFDNYGNISQIFLLDRDNNILYQTFTSTDGLIHTVNSLVLKDDGFLNETICSQTITGTSGTFVCNIPIAYQNSSFYVQTTVDGNFIGSKYFSQGVTINWFEADIFIELLMFSSLVLLLIANPITIIIGAILGITMPILFLYIGQASFGKIIASIIFYIVAGVIIILQMRRKL